MMLKKTLCGVILASMLLCVNAAAFAAPYAALVIDARTGEVLHSRNADTRLHPASLTKMMTLYVTFEAVRLGEITLDTKVKISRHAASEPPSKLGLKAGQYVALRHLIRAASVKSANDAATALGEAISGSEAAFARRMNRTAKALGMTRTTFKNAHGLTESGHMSTARDMALLGRHLFFDYPQYYNLFSRRSTNANGKTVSNTNRKFLAAYKGSDGIKTGYTVAAGFNLVASAQRGDVRIIASMFGGRSTATRNAKVAELLDLGFKRAPKRVAVNRPSMPVYGTNIPAAKLQTAVLVSTRPLPRRIRTTEEIAALKQEIGDAMKLAVSGEELVASAPEATADTARPAARDEELRVVTRLSTSGGLHWSINLGGYNTRSAAEKVLLRTALQDLSALDGALRKVALSRGQFQANFVALNQANAERACARLRSRQIECEPIGPSG